ncbi:hypothetical protein EW146_g4241 [Bondarzewia mesenterica]|uniref:MADS-box domain-containing protein n=1 Tax=Bondarzewia mesenterica TaxID=1095465 RepID=A0A4S4LVB0_9AGAM|nr:hypothetical protein EW146_g4241 [Bondarzewia mesenterica]
MGRRKIEILPIQRKTGLFKKAYELGVLCSVDVAVIIFERRHGHPDKLYQYCSGDISNIVQRHLRFEGERDTRTAHDFSGANDPSRLDDGADDDDDAEGDESPTVPTTTQRKRQDSMTAGGAGLASGSGTAAKGKKSDGNGHGAKTATVKPEGMSIDMDYRLPISSLSTTTSQSLPISSDRHTSLNSRLPNPYPPSAQSSNKRPRTASSAELDRLPPTQHQQHPHAPSTSPTSFRLDFDPTPHSYTIPHPQHHSYAPFFPQVPPRPRPLPLTPLFSIPPRARASPLPTRTHSLHRTPPPDMDMDCSDNRNRNPSRASPSPSPRLSSLKPNSTTHVHQTTSSQAYSVLPDPPPALAAAAATCCSATLEAELALVGWAAGSSSTGHAVPSSGSGPSDENASGNSWLDFLSGAAAAPVSVGSGERASSAGGGGDEESLVLRMGKRGRGGDAEDLDGRSERQRDAEIDGGVRLEDMMGGGGGGDGASG